MVELPAPVDVGLYWLGVGERRGDAVVLGSEAGPFAEGLAEVVRSVRVLAHEPPETARDTEDVADFPVSAPNVELVSLGPKGDRRSYRATARRVREVVGAHSRSLDVLVGRFGRRARTVFDASWCARSVVLVHGPAGAARGGAAGPLLAARARRNLRHVVANAGMLVTDGEACLRAYGSLAPAAAVVRLSVRRARFRMDPQARTDAPPRRFLFAGRLTPDKGVRTAVAAFARVRETIPDATLDVVGDGPELDAARALASAAGGSVTFHGWVPPGERLFGFYRSADVLLFPSVSSTESFPRVVTEAMAHGVCVVATSVGSMREAFVDGRELLFVSADPDDLADAAARLASDAALRRSLREHGARWAEATSLEATSAALAGAILRRWPELASAQRAAPA